MSSLETSERISEILSLIALGDEGAANELLPLVYEELRTLARVRLRTLGRGQSLQPTDLVHEVYLKLVRTEDRVWENRRHFISAAGTAMRSILVDRLRRQATQKHGAGLQRETADELIVALGHDPEQTLAVDQALTRLEQVDPRAAKVVTLRFFLGLSEPEIADALGLTDRTIRRDWVFARAWLSRILQPN